MTTLTCTSVADVFHRAVDLTRAGQDAHPRGMGTREVVDASFRLNGSRSRLLLAAPVRVPNPAFAVAETVWILSGSDAPWIYDFNTQMRQFADDGVLRGAYGPRIRHWGSGPSGPGIDQLRRVVEILHKDPDSRRAVIQIYDPHRDASGHRDVPCTLGFQFVLRHGLLDMVTRMRSQDAWVGLIYDLFFFTTLHELVAGWVGADVGNLHHHVGSLHLYEHNLRQAAALPTVIALPAMGSLATDLDTFDDLLAAVLSGTRTGHPAWDEMGDTLISYRSWKRGERDKARQVASGIRGPFGTALTAWYDKLSTPRVHGSGQPIEQATGGVLDVDQKSFAPTGRRATS